MRLPLLTSWLLFFSAPLFAALLVENGEPRAEIVLAEQPARMAKLAARELQTYVEKISGARLEIVTQPTGAKLPVFVGRSVFTTQHQVNTEGLQHGAFRMTSGPGWLALVGPDADFVPVEPWGRSRSTAETQRVNAAWDAITGDTFWNPSRDTFSHYFKELDVWDYDDAGTLNAVYEFLRGLGVRWYAPGELGEVVPKLRTIPLPEVNRTVTPDFAVRRFTFYTEATGLGEKALWMLRLGLYPGRKVIGLMQPCHGLKFVIMREEMKQAHPELYLSMGGQRNLKHKGSGVPDLLEPMLLEKQVKFTRAMFDHFGEPMVNIDLVDGYGGMAADDPAWMAQLTPERGWPGSMSDHVFGYLNRVAQELYQTHPNKLVCALAYSAYQLPPEKLAALSPNLALLQTRQRQNFWDEEAYAAQRKVRAEWLQKLPSRQYLTWDYSVNARPEQAGRPVYYTRQIARDLRDLKGISRGEMIEIYDHPPAQAAALGYDPLAIEHLNLYVAARLWWNADADVDALVAEYCTQYFGPAAETMRRFLRHGEEHWMHMGREVEAIKTAFTLLAQAQREAPAGSSYAARLAKIAEIMKPLRLLQEQLGRKRETDLTYRVLRTQEASGKEQNRRVLDGQVAKEYWGKARTTSLAKLQPNAPDVRAGTQFQIQREGGNLYIGIICSEPDMAGAMVTTTRADDEKLLAGDYVSILLETPSRSFYELAVNPTGAVLEADRAKDGRGVAWASGAQVAVARGEQRWSVEIRLPIAGEGAFVLDPSKGVDGAQPKDLFPWHFNVCRQRVRQGKVERSAFSPTMAEGFYVPERFAKLWGK